MVKRKQNRLVHHSTLWMREELKYLKREYDYADEHEEDLANEIEDLEGEILTYDRTFNDWMKRRDNLEKICFLVEDQEGWNHYAKYFNIPVINIPHPYVCIDLKTGVYGTEEDFENWIIVEL